MNRKMFLILMTAAAAVLFATVVVADDDVVVGDDAVAASDVVVDSNIVGDDNVVTDNIVDDDVVTNDIAADETVADNVVDDNVIADDVADDNVVNDDVVADDIVTNDIAADTTVVTEETTAAAIDDDDGTTTITVPVTTAFEIEEVETIFDDVIITETFVSETAVDTIDKIEILYNEDIAEHHYTFVGMRLSDAPPPRSDSRFEFFASGRQEVQVVFDEVSSIGLRFELGVTARQSRLLLTCDFGGGINYIGGGLNVGYLFGEPGEFRFGLGASGGYHAAALVVRFENEAGRMIDRRVGHYAGIFGGFIKFLPERTNTVDITLKILSGYRENSAWYRAEGREIYVKDGFTPMLSFSVGYALPRGALRSARIDRDRIPHQRGVIYVVADDDFSEDDLPQGGDR